MRGCDARTALSEREFNAIRGASVSAAVRDLVELPYAVFGAGATGRSRDIASPTIPHRNVAM